MLPNPGRIKNARLNLAAAAVINLMRYGQSLQLEFCGTGPRWRLSGGSKVDNDVARRVIANKEVALFPNTTPQTWRIRK